jgi:hypothetical protein
LAQFALHLKFAGTDFAPFVAAFAGCAVGQSFGPAAIGAADHNFFFYLALASTFAISTDGHIT